MSGSLPTRPSLTRLKKLVKELRRSHAAGNAEALERIRRFHTKFERSSDDELRSAVLAQRSAQLIIAREHGFDSWQELRRHVEFLESGKVRSVYDPSPQQRDAERFKRLIRACKEGNFELVQRILEESPALVNRTDGYRAPLHFAVCGGHSEIVRYLLDRGAHPAHDEEKGVVDRSLDIARTRGYDDIIRAITSVSERWQVSHPGPTFPDRHDVSAWRAFVEEDPARARARDADGNTPLHVAVDRGDRDLIDRLLGQGADVDAIRNDGFRPVHLALYRDVFWTNRRPDRHELARPLLARGARYTASVASCVGDIDRVRALLSEDPTAANDPDSIQKRPLSCAAEGGHLALIELLLEHGADPNRAEAMCHGDGFALFGAVANDHHDCARLLLERGANPNAELDSSGSVYSWCRNDKMRTLVLSYGGRVNITTHVAREEVATVKRLLEQDPSLADGVLHVQNAGPGYVADYLEMFEAAFAHGADPRACPAYALVRALKGMPVVAEFLIEHGVAPELVVHRIARDGDVDAMRSLIQKGVDLECREDQYRGTPLTTAARAGRREMVEFLLRQGAVRRHPDDEEWSTPEYWADKNGDAEVSRALGKP